MWPLRSRQRDTHSVIIQDHSTVLMLSALLSLQASGPHAQHHEDLLCWSQGLIMSPVKAGTHSHECRHAGWMVWAMQMENLMLSGLR